MKLNKGFWARMIPVFIIMMFTFVMSIKIYQNMMEAERETCWERLKIATENTAGKIYVRLTDNLNFLDVVADSFIFTNNMSDYAEVGEYLNSVMEKTIFTKIDVILPDGDLITQQGEKIHINGELSYDELLKKGTHISPRTTDIFLNKEVMYCFTPIQFEGEAYGILCGTIDCAVLGEIFEVYTYRGVSQLFLIDCTDGNYLMDNWHDELGNIYDLGWRQSVEGDEMIDMVPPIINRETGRLVYTSRTNGETSYQYHMPVEGFNWQICVVVQEDIVFANLNKLEKLLWNIGVIEAIVVLIYLAWNVFISISLVKSEKKANDLELVRATNEVKARFMSNMSHDIRTPLNGIVGMLHIIKKHREDEKLVDECLEKIEISTQYLSTLANDMLDINEIESDKLILESIPIDLRKMANELRVMIEPKAKEAKVACSIDCSKLSNPYVLGSPVHIERVLINLMGNAIKYSKEVDGKVELSIEDTVLEEDYATYRFVVKDNGIGMSEEFQKKMYNAFSQEKESARSNYQGYGLGLTIVHRLVEKMNGNITLESEKGVGSTFIVTVPLQLDIKVEYMEPEIEPISDLSGVTILLVEDNAVNMEIVEVLLKDMGATIHKATNGRLALEAFEKSEENYFDLILMDIMMPEMDGFEATKCIRALERADAKKVPIFAMTAHTFTEEVNHCKEVGMNEHVAKPLDVDKFMVKVAKYCGKDVKEKHVE